jgi:hypothetical protein
MSHTITLFPLVGVFASNKDVATDLRITEIMPRLAKNEDIILDFTGVEAGNQSFIHALIAEPIQVYGSEIINHIKFKSCSEIIKTLIGLVVDYTNLSRLK